MVVGSLLSSLRYSQRQCACHARGVATACAVLRLNPALACAVQVVVVLTIAKMSSMHRVRIFGINKD